MITELFNKLDAALIDMNAKKEAYDKVEVEAASLYVSYADAVNVANGIRSELQTALGAALPETAPGRTVRVL